MKNVRTWVVQNEDGNVVGTFQFADEDITAEYLRTHLQGSYNLTDDISIKTSDGRALPLVDGANIKELLEPSGFSVICGKTCKDESESFCMVEPEVLEIQAATVPLLSSLGSGGVATKVEEASADADLQEAIPEFAVSNCAMTSAQEPGSPSSDTESSDEDDQAHVNPQSVDRFKAVFEGEDLSLFLSSCRAKRRVLRKAGIANEVPRRFRHVEQEKRELFLSKGKEYDAKLMEEFPDKEELCAVLLQLGIKKPRQLARGGFAQLSEAVAQCSRLRRWKGRRSFLGYGHGHHQGHPFWRTCRFTPRSNHPGGFAHPPPPFAGPRRHDGVAPPFAPPFHAGPQDHSGRMPWQWAPPVGPALEKDGPLDCGFKAMSFEENVDADPAGFGGRSGRGIRGRGSRGRGLLCRRGRGTRGSGCGDNKRMARLVSHKGLADGASVVAGTGFTKTWNVRNDSDKVWASKAKLTFVGGDIMHDENSQSTVVHPLSPGQSVDVTLTSLVAPALPGQYQACFRLESEDGTRFGQRLWCTVMSAEPQDAKEGLA